MYGTREDWIGVALVWLLTCMPVISFFHCSAMVGGVWFAVGRASLPSRIAAVTLCLLLTATVAGILSDYAIAVSNVGIVSVLLMARECGLELVKLPDGARSRCGLSKTRVRSSFFEILVWLPVALLYLIAVRWLCFSRSITDVMVADLVEAGVLATIFVGMTCACLKIDTPERWVIIVIQFISPSIMAMETLAVLAESKAIDAIVFSNIGHALEGSLLATVFGVPILTGILLAGRRRGYVLVVRRKRSSRCHEGAVGSKKSALGSGN